MSSRFVVSVAVAVPLRKTFDYLPCPDWSSQEDYLIGARCVVPMGTRKMVGVITQVHSSPQIEISRLRPIDQILDQTALIPTSVLLLAQWISDYYHAPLGEVLINTLPPLLRKPHKWDELQGKIATTLWLPSSSPSQPVKGRKQQELWTILQRHPSGMKQQELKSLGFSSAQLKSLEAKQLISKSTLLLPPETTNSETCTHPQLNHEQSAALEALLKNRQQFNTTVLEGVTGSGKTEVYLEWIHALLKETPTGQILVLIPEIALTPQTLRRFRQRFGNAVCVYHSGMNESERLLTWALTANGEARVTVATRSGITLPFQKLAGIIVDEEHDSSFKQQDGARYHTRDLALIRAQYFNCPVVLGSATPSFESLFNVKKSKYQHLKLTNRAIPTPLPKVHLIDTRSRPLEGGISPPLLLEIRQAVARGEQVLVFLNRRGFSPVVMCVDCGWLAECRSCDTRLTYHRHQQLLRCHHCDKAYRLPTKCPKCESANIKPIGAGTERTEDYLEAAFPDTPVIRIDRDTIQTKGSLDERLAPISRGDPCLIVGTQMLAKGHDFPNLSTVAILNADGGLFSSDFRSTEKTAQLLIQVAGRAGRRETEGRVFIQTHFTDHPLLQAIVKHDYSSIYESEMSLRKQGHFPPVYAMALIRGEGRSLEQTMQALWKVRDSMETGFIEPPEIHGPFPAVIQKKQNRFHGLLWCLADDKAQLRRFLKNWLEHTENHKTKLPSGFRWHLDVDPLETL